MKDKFSRHTTVGEIIDENTKLREINAELLETLKLAGAYVEAIHGQLCSAMGHENTAVKPDLDKIYAVIAKAKN